MESSTQIAEWEGGESYTPEVWCCLVGRTMQKPRALAQFHCSPQMLRLLYRGGGGGHGNAVAKEPAIVFTSFRGF